MVIFMLHLNCWEVSSSLVFVDQKRISPLVTSLRSEFQQLLDEFGERQEAIQVANIRGQWPARKNFKCKWCQVIDCQYSRG